MSEIINFFTTENQLVCNILSYPLAFIEMLIFLYFIETILNVKTNKKFILKLLSLFILTFTCATPKILLDLPYNLIPTFLSLIIFSAYYYKISLLKSTLGVAIFTGVSTLIEYLINLFITKLFYCNIIEFSLTPAFKIMFSFSLYLLLYFIICISKHFNTKILISENKEIYSLVIVILLILLIIIPNYFFISLLNMNLPTTYVIYNVFSGFIFFLVGLYSTTKINKLQITERELETATLYTSTLSKLVDSNRAFRHDMANIVNSIGGYIELNDMDGLKNYYTTGLLPEVKKSNNLSLLNPDVINSPPLFGLLLAKYNYADSLGVKIELNSFFDYSTINTNIFDFVKIFGILLDNAIEAASKCNDKFVTIHITIDFYNRKQVFKISNTYLDKNIDVNKIFEKDFSTKEIKSGFGLWEVKQLLKKHKNIKLISSKDDIYFSQKLEIYF